MSEELTDPLVRQIGELRAALADSEARRVELEAVIQKAREAAQPIEDGEPLRARVISVLDSAPSTVLGEHDQEVAARALEDAAWAMWPDKGPDGAYLASVWLRDRAAAIRAGKP